MCTNWLKVQQLPGPYLQQVQAIYTDQQFPLEVRHFLSSWIDAQPWVNLDPENHYHESTIKELLTQFINEIEGRAKVCQEPNAVLTRYKFTKIAEDYKKRFEINYLLLFRAIKGCLVNELHTIQHFNDIMNSPRSSNIISSSWTCNDPHYISITQQLDELRTQANESVQLVDKFLSGQEQFRQKYAKFQELEERINAAKRQSVNDELQMQQMVVNELTDNRFALSKMEIQKRQLEYELRDQLNGLDSLMVTTIDRFEKKSESIDHMISTVLDRELIAWKRSQQLAGNGYEYVTGILDALQTWCSDLTETIYINLTKVKDILKNCKTLCSISKDGQAIMNSLIDLNRKFTAHLTTSVLNTFVLEKQPPQVMKTNTRFSAKIRFLVGSKLNIHLNPPQVKVSIISESQANLLLTEKQFRGEVSGEILNNTGTMEYDSATGQLSITFRNMQLKKIKRAEKKGSESVVDEKFALFFSAKFNIGGELEFGVWTMSLPVTVIVHGNQEPHAWATITWDNAFAEIARRPFVVPDKVPWGKVASALNLKFKAVTGRSLSEENKKYLAEKLFRCQYSSDDYDTMQVTWSQFSKESLADRSFTFWDWFYAIMKLTKEHLKPIWTEGRIHGFLRKQEAENMLSICRSGTFLLRFSDSELGGITIAWVEGDDQKQVTMLQPFTAKDFAIRSLADRIYDLHHLKYLYPDSPKNEVFGQHYTPVTDSHTASPNGYVKPLLVTTVPGVCWTVPDNSGRMSGCNSYPTTPNLPPHSPSGHSAVSEPVGVGSWVESFPSMDYENINNLDDFADFSALQDPSMAGVQSRLSDAH